MQYAFITRLDEEGIKNVDMLVYRETTRLQILLIGGFASPP